VESDHVEVSFLFVDRNFIYTLLEDGVPIAEVARRLLPCLYNLTSWKLFYSPRYNRSIETLE